MQSLNDNPFTRWQSKANESLSKNINTYIILAVGILAFSVDKLITLKQSFAKTPRILITVGITFCCLTIILLLILELNRFNSFRHTAKIVRNRQKRQLDTLTDLRKKVQSLDNNTYRLLNTSLIFLLVSMALIVTGFAFEIF